MAPLGIRPFGITNSGAPPAVRPPCIKPGFVRPIGDAIPETLELGNSMTLNPDELPGIVSLSAICFEFSPLNALPSVTNTSPEPPPSVLGLTLPGTTRAKVDGTGFATPFVTLNHSESFLNGRIVERLECYPLANIIQ